MAKFAPLERLHVGQFELVQLKAPSEGDPPWSSARPAGTWTLQYEGVTYFFIEQALAINRPTALKVFEHILEAHNNAVHIGYSHGVKSAREDMRRALGLPIE